MKKISCLVFCLLFLWTSCTKNNKAVYSTWYVNSEKFSTNDVRADEGKAVHEIQGNDFNNRFFLTFNLDYFPENGSLPIRCGNTSNPESACLVITYHSIGYLGPHNAFLEASSSKGKVSYTLIPTWFYNEKDVNDSLSISGIFNQP